MGDFNNDGVPDLAATAGLVSAGFYVAIYSGADGSELYGMHEDVTGSYFGSGLAGGRDVTQDGQPDLLIGSMHSDFNGFTSAGMIRLVGGETWITPLQSEVSNASGASIDFELDFPDDAAGETYQALLSASGVGPSMFPNQVSVPLTVDAWMAQTFLGMYPPVFLNPTGTLDANGDASFGLQVPSGVIPASLIGTRFYMAVTSRSALGVYRYSTRAAFIDLNP